MQPAGPAWPHANGIPAEKTCMAACKCNSLRELIPRNKDDDYCSMNHKAARPILKEKRKMVMRLRNGEGGSTRQ